MTHRRRFLSHSLGLGLAACLPTRLDGFSTAGAESGCPFSPPRQANNTFTKGSDPDMGLTVDEERFLDQYFREYDLLVSGPATTQIFARGVRHIDDHFIIGTLFDAWILNWGKRGVDAPHPRSDDHDVVCPWVNYAEILSRAYELETRVREWRKEHWPTETWLKRYESA